MSSALHHPRLFLYNNLVIELSHGFEKIETEKKIYHYYEIYE